MTNEQAKEKERNYLITLKLNEWKLEEIADKWLKIDEILKTKNIKDLQFLELKKLQTQLENDYSSYKTARKKLWDEYNSFKKKWDDALEKLYENRHQKNAN